MAYQRYYWFLLALAVAAIRIYGEELREEERETTISGKEHFAFSQN
jgi:hypothetical protein